MLAQVGQGSVSVLCAGGLRENCVCHATRAAEDHPVCKRYLPSCSAFLGGGPVWRWAGDGEQPSLQPLHPAAVSSEAAGGSVEHLLKGELQCGEGEGGLRPPPTRSNLVCVPQLKQEQDRSPAQPS